jgi:hypothetical protein
MDVLSSDKSNRILDTSPDIFNCDLGVLVPDDLFKRKAFVEQLQNILNRDARACDTRLGKVYLGIDSNPLHHIVTSEIILAKIILHWLSAKQKEIVLLPSVGTTIILNSEVEDALF